MKPTHLCWLRLPPVSLRRMDGS